MRILVVEDSVRLADTLAEALTKEHYTVDEALCDVIYPMESSIQENMRMTGNEDQIKQLLSILLDNAVSYSPEGATNKVEAGIHGKRFVLSVANHHGKITVESKDGNNIFRVSLPVAGK